MATSTSSMVEPRMAVWRESRTCLPEQAPFEGSSDWHASPTNSLQMSRWAPKYLRRPFHFCRSSP